MDCDCLTATTQIQKKMYSFDYQFWSVVCTGSRSDMYAQVSSLN
jgi:hypothetical protein